MMDYYSLLEAAAQDADVIHMDSMYNDRWSIKFEIPQTACRGNLQFATNNPEIRNLLSEWSFGYSRHYAPRTLDDVGDEPFMDVLKAAHQIADLNVAVKTAFVVEDYQEKREEQVPLDAPDDDDKFASVPQVVEDVNAREREILEELPLPGSPISEAERKRKWL